DADTVLAGKIDLDRLRDGRGLGGKSILFCRNHHRNQLRNRLGGRCPQLDAIALPPTEYLVRIHVVMPGNRRDRRTRRKRRRADLPLQRLRPRTVTPPPSRRYAHNRLCGHFSPSQRQGSQQTRRNEAIQEGGPRRRDTNRRHLDLDHIPRRRLADGAHARWRGFGTDNCRPGAKGHHGAAAMLVLASGSVTATRASPRWGARPAAAVPPKAAPADGQRRAEKAKSGHSSSFRNRERWCNGQSRVASGTGASVCRTQEINGRILKQMESTSAFSATIFLLAGNLDSFVSLFS